MPEDAISLRRAQETFLETAAELQAIDHRLAAVADAITPRLGQILPSELEAGARCLRSDLLRDAIETLETLGRATEDSVRKRRSEVDAATGMIAAFG